jgi:RimJ/RimL family protein N-acetyltransferase
MFPTEIETERLRFEPATPEQTDVHELYQIYSSDSGIEDVTEWVAWNPHKNPGQTMDLLEEYESKWDAHDRATYCIYPKDSEEGGGEIAGTTNIRVNWDQRRGRLGLWLRKKYWGRGYSGERAAVFLELAFDLLDLDVVVVSHIPGNEKSEKAITRYVDRFGGRQEGYIRNGLAGESGDVYDQVQYSITEEEWKENRQQGGHTFS